MAKFNHWYLIAPNNDFVGAKIVFDERALFNDEWKLHFENQ